MNKLVAIGLLILALFLDLYLIKNGGAFIPNHLRENLAHWFNGNVLDWIGIVLFNATIIFIASGLFGVWEAYEDVGSVAKTIAFGIGLAGGLGLIMLT
ncbi:MAG: hypothetical protein ACEQSR_15145 [Candidatus Methylacidiphilales bacterium]